MESTMDLAAREIMWNIPLSFKVLMYLLLFASLAILGKGLYEKYLFVTNKKPITGKSGLLPDKLNWSNFFITLFFTGKVKRSKFVGLFHGLIFYGFLILWIATDIVAIHADTPFKIYKGTLYIVISW